MKNLNIFNVMSNKENINLESFKDLSLEEIQNQINSIPEKNIVVSEIDNKSQDIFSEITAKNIISTFADKYEIDHRTALVVITKIIQDGGTNSSRPNLTVVINGKPYELAVLKQSIRLHDRFGTVRKLAKTIRSIVACIAKLNKWPGPLYKDVQRLFPNLSFTLEEAAYCSEFNSDNYDQDMPPRLRESLQQREQKIRERRMNFANYKQKPKNNSKGKRKRGRGK